MIPWESCVLWLGYPIQNGVWPDVSKHDNDGIITGAGWEQASVEFDGIDDFVDCGNHSSLDDVNGLTIECLVKRKVIGTIHNIVGKTGSMGNRQYNFRILSDNRANAWISDNGTAVTQVFGPTTVDTNWCHIVFTWDGTTILIYIDTIVGLGANINTMNSEPNEGVYIGVAGSLLSANFDGKIAFVRIYNKAFTAQQVREAYEQCYRLV